jgi:glycosyltransferase involved in cell wall biosynthesis
MTTGASARIGVVMPLAEQRGGAERALMHFLEGLGPDSDARVSLCFLESGPLVDWVRQRGYAAEVMEAGRLRQLPQWSSTVRRVYSWLRRNEIGVVLSWMSKAHLYAGPAAWFARIPALWWQHGVPVRGSLDALVSLVPAKRILACSQAAARAQRRLSGQRAELVAVYPGVDLERLRRAEQARVGRQALGLPAEGLVIGVVARLERWKGIDVLLRAVAELLREHPDLHLVVVGGPHPLEPAYADEIRRLAAELGLGEHVTFCGHQNDAPKWMCEMDIAVNASFGEPFGMVIVEAMALGKAVVATDSGGAPEIVTHEVNGLLVAPGEVAELAKSLSRLVTTPGLRRRLGEAARERAKAFSAPRFVAEVLAAVREESP